MSKYGDIAILAARLFPDLQSPRDAWNLAAQLLDGEEFNPAPQHSFLILCAAGEVLGIPASAMPEHPDHHRVLQALQVLRAQDRLFQPLELWHWVNPAADAHQGQMEALLGLWEVGLLSRELSEV